MRLGVFAIGLAVVGLAGCSPKPVPVETSYAPTELHLALNDLYPAETQLKQGLKDGDSAKFQNVNAYRHNMQGHTVYVFCGKVNAKNGFGAYDGYRRFVTTSVVAAVDQGNDAEFDSLWQLYCDIEISPVTF